METRSIVTRIDRVGGSDVTSVDDVVAVEEPLEIRVVHGEEDGVSVSITMRTPGHDFELAAGFLFSEGILRSREDVASIGYAADALPERQHNVVEVRIPAGRPLDLNRLARSFYTSSSCGVCGKASLDALYFQGCTPIAMSEPLVAQDVIEALPDRMRAAQELFAATGGLHAAGVFTADGTLLSLREDVGRHNAVDKLVGEAFLAGRTPLTNMVLLLSGRASFELIQKAVVAGIPIVAAVGAPSSLAMELAREYQITLVGFLRREGFNLYSAPKRIQLTARTAIP